MKVQNKNNPDYSGKKQLELIEESLPTYNNNITNLITKNFPKNITKDFTLLDFGAGQGSLATLVESKTGLSPECLEIDHRLSKRLASKGFKTLTHLQNHSEYYDAIYSSNVLEHIEDDLAVLRELHLSLKPQGQLIIYVPAFEILYSDMDVVVGHVRRYSRSELRNKVVQAGFRVEELHFVDSIGFPASLFLKYSGYNSKNGIGSANSLKFYDRFIFPISNMIDSIGFKYLFGKNLFLRAAKVGD